MADGKRTDNIITLSDGTQINLDELPKDKKGRPVVSSEIMDNYYKELPDGIRSEDGRLSYNGGILKTLDAAPEEYAREIRRQGAEALHAKIVQRQAISDTIDALLRQKAGKEEIERYNLPENATKQEALIAAMYAEAINKGTVRAADFLRDTVGEKPVERQQIEAEVMTEADKILLEKIRKRLDLKE